VPTFSARYEQVQELARSLQKHRDAVVRAAVRDIQLTAKDVTSEVDVSIDRLGMFAEAQPLLEQRRPRGGEGSTVALMLSYNGSTWLNTAITSIFIVGNRVQVKFSSKGPTLSTLTEAIYAPIFGDRVHFSHEKGTDFLQRALRDPDISTIVIFGSDENVLPYEHAVRQSGKKLVFEGPGQDPFIVFADADLELAMNDLVASKFYYSGQTCIAPKRIFIQRPIYDEFLREFCARVRALVVGNPEDPRTDISPVASAVAVHRIREQLSDAVYRGAKIVCGGEIQGNLIHPTVVRDARDAMLGMKTEVFGPVAFTTPFDTKEEVVARARKNKYGLRAALFGGAEATDAARHLLGEDYCHPVPRYTRGRFGTIALNQSRSQSWRGALVTKPIGGYGYSGWIWETANGAFRIKQGPKLLSIETST
jgi:acyl-CoA reductase-like NAD-dependent aldehyde dehydrogenase